MSARESTFGRDLAAARRERTPVMALRRTAQGELDDVVVEDVTMFRAEMMASDCLWMCCYLRNGERITFDAFARKRGCLEFDTGEVPSDWIDWDERRRAGWRDAG